MRKGLSGASLVGRLGVCGTNYATTVDVVLAHSSCPFLLKDKSRSNLWRNSIGTVHSSPRSREVLELEEARQTYPSYRIDRRVSYDTTCH